MRTKSLLVSILMLGVLILSACGPAAIAPAASEVSRALSITGVGQVSLTPDIAYIYLGVHTEMASASEAVAENNIQTQKVIAALKKMGVEAKDIRTTNFSIWPSQNYGPDGMPLELKYAVDNTVYVTVRDLAKLGDLLDSVITAGANTVNSIAFDVADKTAAMKEARDMAVKNAQEQAQELAAAAGVKLGDITSISFYDTLPYPVFDGYGKGGGGGAEAALAVPIQPGQLTITVSVSMSYEIK
ncbi:MAG: 26 kDa periplasmic immunogenic protein [Anaerolineales bacterium]|nr:26 kDa periplasmic immunogenic protein [Anaerolineales bacterium]